MAVLHAHEYGDPDGPAVLCLHGVTGHGQRFAALAARLSGYRLVGLDLRGHGSSLGEPPWDVEQNVRDLRDTAAALGVERAAWIGHSFGGRLVAELATRHPDLVARAVLLDPALHIPPAAALERAEGLRADESFGSPDEAIDARLSDGSLLHTPRQIMQAEVDAHLVQGGDGRWRWRYVRPAAIGAWSVMAGVAPALPACPTLVVLGAQSWLSVELPETAPGLTTVTVPGGHSVLWDAFDETAVAITAFLA